VELHLGVQVALEGALPEQVHESPQRRHVKPA
jgi:hypothetical protein